MSISFNGPDLQPTYQAIIDGSAYYDWALFNQTANELKVQATGNGLDDLEEEFMDGRIQYGFARVKDPSSSLDKIVLIAWCGEGVPESRKGLFHTHMDQVSSKFLKGAHLVIQARSELDVTPAQIQKRLRESGGSKYGVGAGSTPAAAAASKPAPSYRPSQGLGGAQGKPAEVSAPPTSFNRPTPAAPAAPPAPAAPAPPREPSPPPPAPPAAPSAPSIPANRPQAQRIASANTPAPNEPPKPAAEDRIAPVGTAYEPVKLAKPGKLANRWNPGAQAEPEDEAPTGGSFKDRMAAFSGGGGGAAPAVVPQPSGKKLTWSERQAQAKKQAEEEEAQSQSASAAAGVGLGAAAGLGAGAAVAASQEDEPDAPPPPPPPAPAAPAPTPAASRAIPPRPKSPDSDEEQAEDDDWGDAPAPPKDTFKPEPVEDDAGAAAPPPPPPPPPAPPAPAQDPQIEELQRLKQDLTLEEAPGAGAPPPVPVSTRPGAAEPAQPAGQSAKAVYEYEAAEEGEVSFAEGEILTQIEQLDEGWWSGTNANGQSGLFPSNYVELVEDEAPAPEAAAPAAPPPPPAPPAPPAAQAVGREAEEEEEGEVMIAQYDYDAAEDNEISFKEGDRITSIDKVDEDWWQGTINGQSGLFPAAYVCPPDQYQPS